MDGWRGEAPDNGHPSVSAKTRRISIDFPRIASFARKCVAMGFLSQDPMKGAEEASR